MSRSHPHRPRPRAAGFTLVEVLVALTVMAVLAGMAWQGIDAMARTREASQAAVDRTLRLGAVVAQWEADLQALVDTDVVPALRVDGASARLTRTGPQGVHMVVWTLRGGPGRGSLERWQGPAVTQVRALSEQWLRSQQLLGSEPGTVVMLDDLAALQWYFHRYNAWTNAQSSGDAATDDAPWSKPGGAANGSVGVGEKLPNAVRIVAELPQGRLTRDVLLGPQP